MKAVHHNHPTLQTLEGQARFTVRSIPNSRCCKEKFVENTEADPDTTFGSDVRILAFGCLNEARFGIEGFPLALPVEHTLGNFTPSCHTRH